MPRWTAVRDVLLALIAFAILAAIPVLTSNKAIIDFVIRCASLALFATSLNLLVGYTGMVSFGHGMFFGLGAYSFGLLMQRTGMPIPAAILLSVVISAAAAAVVGAICVRLREIYFAFVTLAFQMLLYSLIIAWVPLTGGDRGLRGGIQRPVFLGLDLANQTHLYLASAALLVAGLLAMRGIVESPFVIAGVFASLGGIVMCLFVSGAYPEFAFWTMSGEGIFIIMLGGIQAFLGPVVGTVILQI